MGKRHILTHCCMKFLWLQPIPVFALSPSFHSRLATNLAILRGREQTSLHFNSRNFPFFLACVCVGVRWLCGLVCVFVGEEREEKKGGEGEWSNISGHARPGVSRMVDAGFEQKIRKKTRHVFFSAVCESTLWTYFKMFCFLRFKGP